MSRKFAVSRIKISFILFLVVILALIVRIGYLSIYKNETYRERIENQSTDKIKLNSGRGMIYDRNNILLTDTCRKDVVIIPQSVLGDNYEKINTIKKNTNLSELDIYKEVQKQLNSSFIELEVEGLTDENIENLKKIDVVVAKKIYRYRDDNILMHTLGYINKSENKGQSGIEKSMEDELAGSNENYISVFKMGQAKNNLQLVNSLGEINKNSQNLKLTVDADIQTKIEKIVDKEENPTAIVVSDVNSGEILAMTSRPSFNPNKIEEFLDKNEGELRNRAISATYPAGSVFKIVVLFAALESDKIDIEDYLYNCTGSEQINKNESLNCNNLSGHGLQSLGECFANSCNTAFYDIAKKVGREEIFKAIKKLHLDEMVDISIEEEVGSKLSYDISLSNLSIGQGAMEFSPLQINQLTQIIANNGYYRHLHIYDSLIDDSFKVIKKLEHSKKDEIISPYTATKIKQLMVGVANNGTAKLLSDLEGGCGVKTGTAQSSIEGVDISHGWVTGFYPLEEPKYAITVLVEGTKTQSKSAVPIFKEICEAIN